MLMCLQVQAVTLSNMEVMMVGNQSLSDGWDGWNGN